MAKNDIELDEFVSTAMDKIKSLVDVSTIVGTPIETLEGDTIIPIAKVSVGFFSGSGEYKQTKVFKEKKIPLSGGIGTGYSINPIGFLVTQKSGSARFLSIDNQDNYRFVFDSVLNFLKNINTKQE